MEKDIWALQQECRELRLAQIETAERLTRLERCQDEESRMKSLWKSPSPFPALLSSAVSLANSNHSMADPSAEDAISETFGLTDEQETDFLSRLSLDDVEVPRRGVSRANSVRFDDAIQSHWISDPQRTAGGDYYATPRSGSSQLSSHAMDERSSSFKSDGRQSRSSLRSHSVGRDTNSMFGDDVRAPSGLSSHVSFPVQSAVIQCSLDEHNNTPHYAAICSGASTSLIESHVLASMGLHNMIERGVQDEPDKIELAVYIPSVDFSFYSTKPNEALPCISAYFNVITNGNSNLPRERASIFIASDILAACQADISFSRNTLTVSVDDGRRVVVPFQKLEYAEEYAGYRTLPSEALNPETSKNPPMRPTSRLNGESAAFVPASFKAPSLADQVSSSSAGTNGEGKHKARNAAQDFNSVSPMLAGLTNMPTQALADRTININDLSLERGRGAESGSEGPEKTKPNHVRNLSSASAQNASPVRAVMFSDTRTVQSPIQNPATESAPAPKNGSTNIPWSRLAGKESKEIVAPSKPVSSQITATGSKRGMKVLRPSRASSIADGMASKSPTPWSQNVGKPQLSTPMSDLFNTDRSKPFKFQLQSRTSKESIEAAQTSPDLSNLGKNMSERSSSSDGTVKKPGHVRKSSNVVGGASAFSWMERATDKE